MTTLATLLRDPKRSRGFLYLAFVLFVAFVAARKPKTELAPVSSSLMIRGYIAVAVGDSPKADGSGLYSRLVSGKDIYLPGITVYVENIKTGTASGTVRTDLSGRFSLHAPEPGRYRICWKSDIYGGGCTGDKDSVTVVGPQFVSSIYIPIAQKKGSVAGMGRVAMADGEVGRLYEPLMNVNTFATVSVIDEHKKLLMEVPVNNFGDYLVPYIPIKANLTLVSRIESESFVQEIYPEAELDTERVHEINLRFENYAPRIDPLAVFDASNKRVQNAAPGAVLTVRANGRDRNGDAIKYRWLLDGSAGSLASADGPVNTWTLPASAGRYAVTVIAFDGKGGYDKATLSILADGQGIPFGGLVVDQGGAPVPSAEVEIVGNPAVKTDASGRFRVRVKEAQRYVFNIRKQGYALNSRVYDRGVTGGRWILRRGQVVTIDPSKTVTVTHRRDERDCPGPDSRRVDLGIPGASLEVPQWQDGKGNVIDPPQIAGAGGKNPPPEEGRPGRGGALLPRDLKLPYCGPGVSVTIPAHSIVDAGGVPVAGPIDVTISTVDLLSPQQMPGDESVVPMGGGGGYIESFGAGALDLPAGLKLSSPAGVAIPVDRSRLIGGAPLPPEVPYLSYDEKQGLWREEGKLTLKTVNGVPTYVGKASHFSPFNADNVKDATSSCVRVFSPTLPGNYDLEVTAPLGGTGAPKTLKKPIDNTAATEHVIYNLPNNTNITLAPMTQGATPQLLGYYVVNSGPIQVPPSSPFPPPGPPYDDCNNFVVLSMGQAPESPFGGEFLHGIGFIDGANLGFDDLTFAGPTGNALKDAIVAASLDYYNTLDPVGDFDTFAEFKSQHGFGVDPNVPAVGEIVVSYANSGDLGFGRDMHCKNNGGDIACYVTNYGNGYVNIANGFGAGGGTPDVDDADAAAARATVGGSAEVATVAMEYAQIGGVGPRIVKFYVYKKDFPNLGDYDRSISANLDGRGERPVPQLCMICHGGLIPSQAGGVPAFSTPAQVNLNSRFVPFDHRFFTFPGDLAPNAAQEAAIKSLNQNIVDPVPTGAPASDPIREVVSALYNGGGAVNQQANSPVPGWQAGAGANAPGQTDFYNDVVTSACRMCHIAQPFDKLNFKSSSTFIHLANATVPSPNHLMLGTVQNRVCGDYLMPHALRTHDIFWGRYTDIDPVYAALSMPSLLQTFGDNVPNPNATWKANLCTSFISGTVSSPSNFYEQSIQPIWNGKCVGCHISGGAAGFMQLTQGNSHGALVGGGRVIPGDDTAGALVIRTTAAAPADRMPPLCFRAPEPDNGNLPCLLQGDIDKIKAWIRSGAN